MLCDGGILLSLVFLNGVKGDSGRKVHIKKVS